MSIFDNFTLPRQQIPIIQSILPTLARQEIMAGRLPVLRTSKVFFQVGEQCHYIDKAIFEEAKIQRRVIRRHSGYSTRGIFKGDRIHLGGGDATPVEHETVKTYRGILYITNQRIIFVGDGNGFDLKMDDLVAITPYQNCVELQCKKTNYKIFVPDGSIVHAVLQQVK